jgi:hypothetical protein
MLGGTTLVAIFSYPKIWVIWCGRVFVGSRRESTLGSALLHLLSTEARTLFMEKEWLALCCLCAYSPPGILDKSLKKKIAKILAF